MNFESLTTKNKSLKEFTSWKVGGEAEFYAEPKNIEELKTVFLESHKRGLKFTVLGGGTNVLISDRGIKGLVIHTHKLVGVETKETAETVVVEALAGTPKAEVLKVFLKLRLQPAVFLAGLPGDMAGGVVMNAGVGHQVKPREFVDIIDSFDTLCIEKGVVVEKSFHKDDVHWDYRKSSQWQPGIITKVRVFWPNEPSEQVLKSVREGNKRRKETQPLAFPSCGSVFKNPEGDHAGRLIEAAGLKGFSIGGAQVSEKHANFIVNTGRATAAEVHQLINHVQKSVQEKQGILLTNEVVYCGDW